MWIGGLKKFTNLQRMKFFATNPEKVKRLQQKQICDCGSVLNIVEFCGLKNYKISEQNIRKSRIKLKTARKLYEKHGFKKIAEVGDLFRDRKEELFYVVRLQGKY